MRRRIFLVVIILLWAFNINAQTIINTGGATTVYKEQGGRIHDSLMAVPKIDTTRGKAYCSGCRTIGRVAVASDSNLYYYNGKLWKKINDQASVSGTSGFIPKFSTSTTLSNSLIRDDGSGVGVGAAAQASTMLYVNGATYLNGVTVFNGNTTTYNGNYQTFGTTGASKISGSTSTGDFSFQNETGGYYFSFGYMRTSVYTPFLKHREGTGTRVITEFTDQSDILWGTSTVDASAAINVVSTTKGVAFPRMTTTQKNAISTPLEGLQLYDNTTHEPNYYNGTAWIAPSTTKSLAPRLDNAYVATVQAVTTASGDLDLFTCPTGKRAYVYSMYQWDTTGSTITHYYEVKSGGSYYRLTTNATTTTLAQNAVVVGFILEGGESIAINATAGGLIVNGSITVFDSTSNVKTAKVLTTSTGNNTVYTCPSGKTATFISGGLVYNSNAGADLNFVADAGGTRTYRWYVVPSGGSINTLTSIHNGTTANASNRGQVTSFTGMVAGTYLNLNVDTGGGTAFATVMEY